MDTCMYNGNEFYSWSLIDEDNQYDKKLLGVIKRSSERRELICIGCEEKVFLRAGGSKQPHFAHYAGSHCSYDRTESLDSRKGKALIRKMAERSFPESNIELNYRMPDNKYSTLFINEGKGISIDFHHNGIQSINYDERSRYYIDNNIPFLHVFSGYDNNQSRKVGISQSDTVQRLQGYSVFLNMYETSNKLSIRYEMDEKHPVNKYYENFFMEDYMMNYRITYEGKLFYIPKNSTVNEIIGEFSNNKKEEYNLLKAEQERIRVKQEETDNRLAEVAKQRREKAESEQQRIAEEMKSKEKLEIMKRSEEQKRRKERSIREESIRGHENKRMKVEFYDMMLNIHLERMPYRGSDTLKGLYSLQAINETWLLPPLLTHTAGIYPIKDNRAEYMKDLNTWLYKANKQQKDYLVRLVCSRIEVLRFDDEWKVEESKKDFHVMKECKNCVDYNKFFCKKSYDDGFCKFTKCVSKTGVCSGVRRSCDDCHHNYI